ncbi:dihydroorotate dehydrogenase [Bacillus sp. KH172YL63]|uniref:dihydroorotate dehydrogenase n=1 Tax=Bacillus sp. KH172YL63 TaxID=2709784 RepID=UPI0013E4218A|nr:hypothetical protein KH172YL63_17290 [Bacillus sp. KH172YL63]
MNGITYPNPVGLCGKIDPLLSGTSAFANLGFGFIEIGPVTLSKETNPATPVVIHQEEQIIFPSPLESAGLERTVKKIKGVHKKQPFLFRLTGTEEEISTMMDTLSPYADGYVIHSDDPLPISNGTKPVFIINPTMDRAENMDRNGIEGFLFEYNDNLTLLETLSDFRKAFLSMTIIASGAIHEPAQALSLLENGADFILLSDGYVFSGPGLPKRITEALMDEIDAPRKAQSGWLSYWFFGLFIVLGGLLALIFSLTSVMLSYDEFYLGMTKDSIYLFNERIIPFMAHDRMTLAGTMISGGIVYCQLAYHGVRNGLLWAKQAIDLAALTGFLGIFLFIGYGYFDWLHLLFWLLLLPFHVHGWIRTKGIYGTPSSGNRRNHKGWAHSLQGQLAFVLLGFSFLTGGIVISYLGITSVFVPTDLLYLCMPPEMLSDFNDKLIPVIAHDRAGFGSALFSVGLLVLTLSLWGFQQGNRWVWRTLLIGGIPAFFAGIYIHFAIGYTTFIHLLPAYFALSLYVFGLIRSYPYFHLTKDESQPYQA